MRVAWSDEELVNIIPIAQGEAKSAFGNPDVYVEKYLSDPRHIEIQFLADNYGNVVHLGERDCSIQRRHQKLVEESPSPSLSRQIREEMGEAVKKGVKKVGYSGAGTMEFLYDTDGKYYFMEVNTRIQVEHPVTEMVTSIDIVKEQIRIAMGEKLSFTQDEVKLTGNAIECRVNAEDPFMNFMPTPGVIEDFHIPGGPGIRVDTHGYAGYEIPKYYDSLLAKVIAWGRDRDEALARMKRALQEFKASGIKTTIPFYEKLLENQEFQKGLYSTKFLENFKFTS
jgi:acetyl-CoA carboxylase biotin carboxylase subunit